MKHRYTDVTYRCIQHHIQLLYTIYTYTSTGCFAVPSANPCPLGWSNRAVAEDVVALDLNTASKTWKVLEAKARGHERTGRMAMNIGLVLVVNMIINAHDCTMYTIGFDSFIS